MGVERDRKVGAWTPCAHSLVRELTAEGTHTHDAGNGSGRARLLKARRV